jgi:hypothetical protein
MTVRRLTELPDYQVAQGDSDIRGWHVLDATGKEAGIIEDLIVDTQAKRVLEAEVDMVGRDVHVPIGAFALDEKKQLAHLPYQAEELARLPADTPWHSKNRQAIRATFFPHLSAKDVPPVGELDYGAAKETAPEDALFQSQEPAILRIEERLYVWEEP